MLKRFLGSEQESEQLKRFLGILPAVITQPLGVTIGRKPIPGNDSNHQWQHAGPGDRRGPCPGANILANYGYIPRNGVATIQQQIFGMMEGLGVGLEISTLLAVVGTGMCGDISTQKLSIGEPHSATNPLGYFGPPACGLTHCHNSFEVDMSIGFDDYYFHGTSVFFNSTRWEIEKNIIDQQNGGIWDEHGMAKVKDWQFPECVAHNPQCTRGFGIIFDIGDNFLSTIMPPSGADGNPLPAEYRFVAPFFGVSFNSTTNKYEQDLGGEKLPPYSATDPNWYRRAIPLTSVEFAAKGLVTFLEGQPTPHLPGRNTGTTNSYFIDPNWQPPAILTDNSWACWMFRFVTDILPCDSGSLLTSLLLNILSWVDNGINAIYTPFCLAAGM